MDLERQIEQYKPTCEQEEADRLEMLRRLGSGEELLLRTNASAHFTASAWVTDASHSQVLMCYHRIYDSWSWLGGHADGCEDLLQVALREVSEESGLRHVRPIQTEPISLEILTVDGHMKGGAYVSSHLHLNLTYLVEADAHEPLSIKEDENAALAWFTPDAAIEASSEPWFRHWVYPKLNERLRSLQ
jgi:8-oxo-dGTP pyrophosphatase MutT (NUDIX family)